MRPTLLLAAWLWAVATLAPAAGGGLPGVEPKLLPPEQAFRFSARSLDVKTLEARFDVAEGYYLYREKLRFAVDGGSVLGKPELPAGKPKHDEFFGDVETYRGVLLVRLPIADGAPGQSVVLKADSQGCADVGVCYPPTLQQVKLSLPAAGAGPGPLVDAAPTNPPKKGWFQ
jgi:thioredoxin:protein disulfide reductase